ncbi:MAG: efflux RND transporter periplasmic adaptor subunit [Myxacorys chilensis ATA2-1-KO14]|jgi:RND family efflux transporter MFP subunit|nr:efflux RND transporter periplasmic adaptor subunit [Myxacorys chilensis ATA2-1-KO14]
MLKIPLFQRSLKPLLLALFVTVSVTACKKSDPSASAKAPPALPVKVQTVESGQVEDSAEFVGSLEALSRVSLQPQVPGRVEGVFVASGDRVQQGKQIFSLSLDQTQADVLKANAATNSARAALNSSEAQLQAIEADRVKAASDVELKRADFNRTQQLVAVGAQPRRQLDVARNDLNAAIATLQAATKQVGAARANVNQFAAGVKESEAETAAARVSLNQKDVTAPINGVVGDFSVKVGDYVNTGQTVTTIIQNDALDMRISVPSNDQSKLRIGLPVDLIDPNTNQSLARGNINFISPQIESGAQSILVKARFPNPERKLRDGQYVRAKVLWSQSPGILIPTTAVTRIGGQSFVFAVDEDTSQGEPRQVAHQRPVKLGDVQGDSYQVTEGIKAGDRIAVSNTLKLRDGSPVQPQS